MNCFYHPERPAVGICKQCRRGLCSSCASIADDALACIDRHEAQVAALNELERQNIIKSKRTRSDYMRNTTFYGIVGILFTSFGISQLNWLGIQAVVYLFIGLALLYASFANYMESRKYL